MPSARSPSRASTPRSKDQVNYNFIHVAPQAATASMLQISSTALDSIMANVIETWARRIDESDRTVNEKVTKLWHALVRQSQAGESIRTVIGHDVLPNPVCTAIYLEVLAEVLRMILPPNSIGELLLGGLTNSIYRNYNAEKSYYENEMYCTEDGIDLATSVEKQSIRTLYSLYTRLDTSSQHSVALDLIKPHLSTDILGELWDTLMTRIPQRDHTQISAHMKLYSRCFVSLPHDEKQEILPILAESVQRRIEEFLPGFQSAAQNDEDSDRLEPLHPIVSDRRSMNELVGRKRSSGGRASFFATKPAIGQEHKLSVKPPPLVRPPSFSRRQNSDGSSKHQLIPSMTRSNSRRKSRMDSVVNPNNVLATFLPAVMTDGKRHTSTIVHQPSMSHVPHTNDTSGEDTSAELLEFIEEIADDLKEVYLLLRGGEYRGQQSAMQDLSRLLTTRLNVELEEPHTDAKEKEVQAVSTIIQMLKTHPNALGSAIKQVPDLLVETLETQQGILKYCMVHCAHIVRQFLKMDAAATELWHAIVKSQSKGLSLLWSTDKYTADEVVVSPIEAAFQWLTGHAADAAKVLLLNHDLAKTIFAAMESETAKGKASSQHRLKALLIELEDLPTFQNQKQLATQKGFEMAMQHDMKGVVQMLTIILTNNSQLKELIGQSVEITAALAMHNKHALLNLLNSDVATWKPFFVQMMAQNDFLLIDSLITKTKHFAGGAQLLVAYHSVLDGIAGHWVTDDADQPNGTIAFKAKSHFARALSVLRLTQNQRKIIQNSTTHSSTSIPSLDGHGTSSTRPRGSFQRGKKSLTSERIDTSGVSRSSIVPGVYHTPWIWKTFLIDTSAATSTMNSTEKPHPWGRRELKRFILDILIEKIKQDELETDEDGVSDLSVYVCDYLMTKLQNRSLVCFQLQQLVHGIQRHIEDPRVSFFASACGVKQLLRRGVLHSCLRSLSHLLFGVLKIFRPENRLQELVDGSCVVPEIAVVTAARNVFAQCLSGDEMEILVCKISELRHFPASDIAHELSHVDVDDAMAVYQYQWQQIEAQMDEQFIHAFNRYRGANQEYVGIDQFVKIITTVTRNGISVRDCRLIFYDTGKEMIDLNTLLHLTQEYDLRISLAHPKVLLDEYDFEWIRKSIGITSVLSFEDEFKQLVACWTEIKPVIEKQITSIHQSEETKQDLSYRLQAVEDSLSYMRSGIDTPSMNTAWETFRSSIASLQAAVNAERSFSILYVQCHVRKWVSKLKKKQTERKSMIQLESKSPRSYPSNALR